MKSTIYRGNPVPFVMELPNYRIPSPKSGALLMWDKARDFLTRAFTVIFIATVIIWFLQSFDLRFNVVKTLPTACLRCWAADCAGVRSAGLHRLARGNGAHHRLFGKRGRCQHDGGAHGFRYDRLDRGASSNLYSGAGIQLFDVHPAVHRVCGGDCGG